MLASGADDLRIWDGEKYDMVTKHYSPPVQKISSLAWNSINTQIASIAPGGCTIDITNAESTDDPLGYPIIDEAVSVCWHSGNRYLGLGCADGIVKVYDLKNQTTKKSYSGHKSSVSSLTYNYNDTTLASASKAGEIILHNTITDLTTRLMTTLKLQAIQAIQFSLHSPSLLASVSDDASLVLWDANARRSIHQFTRSHKAPATDLAFSPANDKLLMSCGLDKNIVLYDVASKSLVRTLQVDTPLSSISMHSNGYQLASGTIRGHILLHDLRQGSQLQHSFVAHRTSVQCLAFHNKIIPKKNKSHISTSTRSSASLSHTNTPNVGESHRETHPPLATVDLNVVSSTPADRKVDAVDSKLATPRITTLASSNSYASIFSPDIEGEVNVSNRPAFSGESMNKASGDSLFSPEVSSRIPVQPVSATNLVSNGNSSPPRGTDPSPLTNGIAANHRMTNGHRRELPTPPRANVAAIIRTPHDHHLSRSERPSPHSERPSPHSERLSPPSERPSSFTASKPPSVQFASTGHSSRSSPRGAANVIGSSDLGDPLTQRIKEELKNQLKSELVVEIKDMVESATEDIKQSMVDHHYEMIRQFYQMQVHVETQTALNSLNQNLVRENEELKAEIERLRRTY